MAWGPCGRRETSNEAPWPVHSESRLLFSVARTLRAAPRSTLDSAQPPDSFPSRIDGHFFSRFPTCPVDPGALRGTADRSSVRAAGTGNATFAAMGVPGASRWDRSFACHRFVSRRMELVRLHRSLVDTTRSAYELNRSV